MDINAIRNKIILEIPDIKISLNEAMSNHTSFRIGGFADVFIETTSSAQLAILIPFMREIDIKTIIIGNGSNLLVSDEGIHGCVIKTGSNKEVSVNDDNCITADAGILLSRLALDALQNGLTGLEFAHGIPGSLGGAIYMNAGAYGSEMKEIVAETTYVSGDGKIKTIIASEHEFEYRSSFFRKNKECVILYSKIQLKKGETDKIRARLDELMTARRGKQPLEYPSAGSVFKRPTGYYAGTLIEQCGLKGYTIGGAQVSTKHAGFIINKGGATCKDVLNLIEYIKETVYSKAGVLLECEIQMI